MTNDWKSVKLVNMVVPSPSRHPFLALVNNASKGYREGDRQCCLIVQWKPCATTTRKQAPSSQKQLPIQNTGRKTDSFSWCLPLISHLSSLNPTPLPRPI